MKENFLRAIEEKLLVMVTFKSNDKGILVRKCVPFDFGPSKKPDAIDKTEKYHFWDLESPSIPPQHNLPVKPENIISIELSKENFDPKDYITWPAPYNWFIARDWGIYS